MTSGLISSLFPTLGSTRAGWVSLSATQPVVGMQLMKLDDSATSMRGLAAIEGQQIANSLCLPHYDCGPAWWTRFAIANSSPLGGFSPILSLRAYGNDGVLTGGSQFIPGYNERILEDVKDIFCAD